MTLGTYLAQLRKTAVISGADLGRCLGRARNTIWAWENDAIELSAENLARYLEAVGASDADRLRALELAQGDVVAHRSVA